MHLPSHTACYFNSPEVYHPNFLIPQSDNDYPMYDTQLNGSEISVSRSQPPQIQNDLNMDIPDNTHMLDRFFFRYS